jgi:DNA-binding MarR family transcriptional regulator
MVRNWGTRSQVRAPDQRPTGLYDATVGKRARAKDKSGGKRRHRADDAPSPARTRGADRTAALADTAPIGIELAADVVSLAARVGRQLGRTSPDGLTRARISALERLVLGGPCTLGELATREGVRPPTMTRLMQAMEASGLVARQRHPTDGRSILMEATAAGVAVLLDAQDARLAELATAIDGLSVVDRVELSQGAVVLERVLGSMARAVPGGRARPPMSSRRDVHDVRSRRGVIPSPSEQATREAMTRGPRPVA